VVRRMLSVIYNPNRYRSKAAESFSREVLPLFASPALRDGFNLYADAGKVSDKGSDKGSDRSVPRLDTNEESSGA
jgi:hypothetical protein